MIKKITEKDLVHALSSCESTLVLPLIDDVYKLMLNFNECFIKPPAGIYRKTSLLPSLVPGVVYYKENGFMPFYYEHNFNDLKVLDYLELAPNENLLDADFNIVISYKEYKNKNDVLTIEPNLNVNILKYIKLSAWEAISNTLSYDYTIEDNAGKILSSEGYEKRNEIDAVIENVLDIIYEYALLNPWHIYDVSILNTDLLVKKIIDWRVFEWLKIQVTKE